MLYALVSTFRWPAAFHGTAAVAMCNGLKADCLRSRLLAAVHKNGTERADKSRADSTARTHRRVDRFSSLRASYFTRQRAITIRNNTHSMTLSYGPSLEYNRVLYGSIVYIFPKTSRYVWPKYYILIINPTARDVEVRGMTTSRFYGCTQNAHKLYSRLECLSVWVFLFCCTI